MTKKELFEEGRSLWLEYVRLFGYAFEPKDKNIREMSRLLDLNVPYIKKCINVFLEA